MCICNTTKRKECVATTHKKNELCALHIMHSDPLTAVSVGNSTCIPINHPLKIMWDICTIFLSLTAGLYTTHAGMRDKCFPHLLNNKCASKTALPFFFGCIPGDVLVTFLDLWCVADIMFNFLLEDRSHRREKRSRQSYLKTWFLVDVISMLSWEVIFVQPVFHQKKKIVDKVIDLCKVLPVLKKRLPLLVKLLLAVKAAKCRLSSLFCFIRFAPKYIVFTLKMKVVLLMRVMRHVRLQRRLFKNLASLCFADRTSVQVVLDGVGTVAPAA